MGVEVLPPTLSKKELVYNIYRLVRYESTLHTLREHATIANLRSFLGDPERTIAIKRMDETSYNILFPNNPERTITGSLLTVKVKQLSEISCDNLTSVRPHHYNTVYDSDHPDRCRLIISRDAKMGERTERLSHRTGDRLLITIDHFNACKEQDMFVRILMLDTCGAILPIHPSTAPTRDEKHYSVLESPLEAGPLVGHSYKNAYCVAKHSMRYLVILFSKNADCIGSINMHNGVVTSERSPVQRTWEKVGHPDTRSGIDASALDDLTRCGIVLVPIMKID